MLGLPKKAMNLHFLLPISQLGTWAPIVALGDPVIYPHRGACVDAPENSLLAVEKAWNLGAAGIECDFRMTTDGTIVCIHDATTPGEGGEARGLVVTNDTNKTRKALAGRAQPGDP